MTAALYIWQKDADALAVCAAAAFGGADLSVNVLKRSDKLPKDVTLPMPSAGLPALVTPQGTVLQSVPAAVKYLGALLLLAALRLHSFRKSSRGCLEVEVCSCGRSVRRQLTDTNKLSTTLAVALPWPAVVTLVVTLLLLFVRRRTKI